MENERGHCGGWRADCMLGVEQRKAKVGPKPSFKGFVFCADWNKWKTISLWGVAH